jgi:hypothetical protein
MTTLRNRLFTTFVLTAALVCALGVEGAAARSRLYSYSPSSRTTATALSAKDHPATPLSGEPDAGSGTAPKTTPVPTSLITPTGTGTVNVSEWIVKLWAIVVASR